MARALRIEFEGAIYHVSCRLVGSWRDGDRELFRDDADRERFLQSLGERVETFDIRLYQYVLMANHFHLVFETPRGNCSAFMHALLTSYTVYFNLRHGRHGHLFDGRFDAKLVEGDRYLLGLSRYVHLNPVRVGRFQDDAAAALQCLRRYPWSSYLQYIGRRKPLDFVTPEATLALLRGPKRERASRYRAYVQSGLTTDDEELQEALSACRLSIGSESFRDRIQGLYASQVSGASVPEDIALRKKLRALPADTVLDELATALDCEHSDFTAHTKRTPFKAFAARYLARYAGLSQRQIAPLIGVGTGAAVSQQQKRYNQYLADDRRLRKVASVCDAQLARLRAAKGTGQ